MSALTLGVTRSGPAPSLRIDGEAGTSRLLVAGTPGAGKTSWLGSVIGAAAVRPDVQLVGIDAKAVDMVPWAPRLSWLAVEDDAMTEVGKRLEAFIAHRRHVATSRRWRWWRPSVEEPAVVVVVDELAHAFRNDELRAGLDTVLRVGRAFGVAVAAATQQPNAKVFGGTELRSMFTFRAALFDPEGESYRMAYGSKALERHAHLFGWLRSDRPGLALFTDGSGSPSLARAYYWRDEDVDRVVAATAHLVQPLDELVAVAA